jgi:hypothetical protein
MTITTSQLDELERRALVHRNHGNSATISVPLDVTLQLVEIARAALAWSERLDTVDEYRWHPYERELYRALRGAP